MHQPDRPPDIARTTLQLLAIGALIVSTFLIVRPFLVAATWAATIAVATWPVLLRVQSWLGGRRGAAVAVLSTVLLFVLLLPLYFGVSAVVENAGRLREWSGSLATLTVPRPPAWVASLPLVGTKLALRWEEITSASPEEMSARLAPFAQTVAVWFVGQVGSLGLLLLQFLMTVVIVAILYANGDTAARGVERFARRLAGSEGEASVLLAARAVRAVALGVVVTAVVQSALVGIGLAVAGVPFVGILVVVCFILAVAQIGPMPVLIPAVVWVWRQGGTAWGVAFLVWAVVCGTLDNFLRPVLIRRGADLPLLLIFAGVIGGLVAFGVIGLFIGPVVLAVVYTLLVDWVSDGAEATRAP